LQWQRNRKAVSDVLTDFANGKTRRSVAKVLLRAIGMPDQDIETILRDASDGQIDSLPPEQMESVQEAERKTLNRPFRTSNGPKKFAVYVKNQKGNVIRLPFGDPKMKIQRDKPGRRRGFRARHNCDDPGPKWKARYWSCRFWSKPSVSKLLRESYEEFIPWDGRTFVKESWLLKTNPRLLEVRCPTGKGGGIDNSCKRKTKKNKISSKRSEAIQNLADKIKVTDNSMAANSWIRGDGDSEPLGTFAFETSDGSGFIARVTPATGSFNRSLEQFDSHYLEFADENESRDITGKIGTGQALETFDKISASAIKWMQSESPDVLTFNAKEPNRARLYQRLSSTATAINPSYAAYEIRSNKKIKTSPEDLNTDFILVRKDKEKRVLDALNARGIDFSSSPLRGASKVGEKISESFTGIAIGKPIIPALRESWYRPIITESALLEVRCPTGKGGGIDNSCKRKTRKVKTAISKVEISDRVKENLLQSGHSPFSGSGLLAEELRRAGATDAGIEQFNSLVDQHRWGGDGQQLADQNFMDNLWADNDLGSAIRANIAIQEATIEAWNKSLGQQYFDRLAKDEMRNVEWMHENGMIDTEEYPTPKAYFDAKKADEYKFEPMRFYRKGEEKDVMPTSTNPEGGQSYSVTGAAQPKFNPDRSWSYDELQKNGYRVLGGFGQQFGYQGESEVTWIKADDSKSAFTESLLEARDGDGDGLVDDGKPSQRAAEPKKPKAADAEHAFTEAFCATGEKGGIKNDCPPKRTPKAPARPQFVSSDKARNAENDQVINGMLAMFNDADMAGLQSVKHPSPKVMEYAKALQKALHASGVKGGNPIDLFGSSTAMHQRGGVWTEERRQLHARIYDKLLAGAQPVDNPLFVLLGGGSASGKSTLTSGSLPEIPGSIVRVDSDQIKAMLPEYAQTSGKDARAAAFVHDESAFMAKELAAIASSRGYNTMLDGTGNGSEGGLAGKVGIAKKRGMKVVAVYATTDLDTALKRNAERAKTDGRMVPNSFLRYSHSQVSALFPRFVKNGSFDEAHLYETTGEPKKIATYRDGALDVHDQGAWQSFLNKASE
jgi:predicted ABC-type ATPase